jgi:hypothetical protein
MVIKPEISKLVKSAGITPTGIRKISANVDDALVDKLEEAGLSIDELLQELSSVIRTEEGAVRLQAIKTALQAHKIDSEPEKQGTTVNIIINDPSSPANVQVVNPILLPRQLEIK